MKRNLLVLTILLAVGIGAQAGVYRASKAVGKKSGKVALKSGKLAAKGAKKALY